VDDKELQRLLTMGMIPSEIKQVQKGHRTEDDILVDRQVRNDSYQWIGVALQDWPPFEVRWNIDKASHHRSLDGKSRDAFAAEYPDVIVMKACPYEIVAALPESKRRTKEPWEGDFQNKTAKVIAAWVKEIAITPPVLVLFKDGVMLAGGWHRFHVAMKRSVPTVKVLVRKSEISNIRLAVPSLAPAG